MNSIKSWLRPLFYHSQPTFTFREESDTMSRSAEARVANRPWMQESFQMQQVETAIEQQREIGEAKTDAVPMSCNHNFHVNDMLASNIKQSDYFKHLLEIHVFEDVRVDHRTPSEAPAPAPLHESLAGAPTSPVGMLVAGKQAFRSCLYIARVVLCGLISSISCSRLLWVIRARSRANYHLAVSALPPPCYLRAPSSPSTPGRLLLPRSCGAARR